MSKYRVTVYREYWGYIDVKAESEEEAVRKVEQFEYADDEEFVHVSIGTQGIFGARKLEET